MTPAVPCYMKTHGFRPSLIRSHPAPQTARPAMSNSRLGEVWVLWENDGSTDLEGA